MEINEWMNAHLLFTSHWARVFILLFEGRQSSAQWACYLPSLSRYPFVHLGWEEQVRVKCLAQGHNTGAHTGCELTTLGPWVRSSTAELRVPIWHIDKEGCVKKCKDNHINIRNMLQINIIEWKWIEAFSICALKVLEHLNHQNTVIFIAPSHES